MPPAKTPDEARALAREIAGAVEASGGSLLLSFTRRTPAEARKILAEALMRMEGLS